MTLSVDVIGIGAGSPRHLTLEAIGALRHVDVAFVMDKGETKSDLLEARRQILRDHAPHVELVTVPDPPRDRDPRDYGGEVVDWHTARAHVLAEVMSAVLDDAMRGAFLVWGDPMLYDSTLRILDRIRSLGHEVESRVIPGITAIQALTAAHGVTLNSIGRSVLVTTGRRLGERATAGAGEAGQEAVVMLDGGAAWLEHADPAEEIIWGAYLGTDLQVLRRGLVGEVGEEIAELKTTLRAEHGWIMDIYLLREARATE